MLVIAALVQAGPLLAECLPTLQLELLPNATVVTAGEPIEVTVTLRNRLQRGAPTSLRALVPNFLLEAEPHSGAYPVVLFEVVAPTGELLKPTKPTFAIPVRPPLEKFGYLAPGQFFGATISLSEPPLGFDMRQRGRYSIAAKVTTSARDYVDAALRQSERKQLLSLTPQDVFQGTLRSNAIEIVVQ